MPIRRNLKNVVKNYTDPERKVREATSNDPWGPSSTLMSEIAEKTHNPIALQEIMAMIWRRLDDPNKHWRHVYKGLVLLEYLIKGANERVAMQSRDNIHVIDTLKEFERTEDGKDVGLNVRLKAQAVANLLRNRERLEEEREKTRIAHQRISHCSGLGHLTSSANNLHGYGSPTQRSYPAGPHIGQQASPNIWKPPSFRAGGLDGGSRSAGEFESFTPQSFGEEQLQLQLALAISKEEHDREESRRRDEELKVQIALEQSRRDSMLTAKVPAKAGAKTTGTTSNTNATGGSDGLGLFNLVDTSLSAAPANQPDPWGANPGGGPVQQTRGTLASLAAASKPNSPSSTSLIPIDDPWSSSGPVASTAAPAASGGAANVASTSDDIWSLENSFGPPLIDISASMNNNSTNKNAGNLFGTKDGLAHQANGSTGNSASVSDTRGAGAGGSATNGGTDAASKASESERRHTPADFLGEHKDLVDLDRLIVLNPVSTNPFATRHTAPGGAPTNPFATPPAPKPSLNELAPNRPAQPVMPLPNAYAGFPVFPRQPLPVYNPAFGAIAVAPGAVAVGPGLYANPVPVVMGQYAWTTAPPHPAFTSSSVNSQANPSVGSTNTTPTLNPFY